VNGLTVNNCSFGPNQGNDDIGFGHRYPSAPLQEGWGALVHFTQLTHSTFTNNTFVGVDSLLQVRMNSTNGDGLILDNSSNNLIRSNQFGNIGHIALSLRNSGVNIVEHNTIENKLHTAFAVADIVGNPGSCSGTIFRQNLIKNINQFPSYDSSYAQGVGIEILSTNSVSIYSNIIENGYNDATGLSIVVDPNTALCTSHSIYNNTFYSPGGRGIDISNFGNIGTKNGIINNVIRNNIIVGVSPPVNSPNAASRNAPIVLTFYQFEEHNGYGNRIENNLLYASDGIMIKSRTADCSLRYSYNAISAPWGTQNVFGDPSFIVNGQNLGLLRSSPAVNRAVSTRSSIVTRDYNDHVLANGNPDIGAIYSGCSPVTSGNTPILGDINSDGKLNGLDVQAFVNCEMGRGTNCGCADMNIDGMVDEKDIVIFVSAVIGN